jgi:hypothetical protein
MDDALNTIETEIVNLLQGDGGYIANDITSGVGHLVEPTNVHEKFHDDISTYNDHELPAVAVMSFDYSEVSDNNDEVNVKIQVTNAGGDLATMDRDTKIIVGKIVKLLKKQRPTHSTCLRDNAEDIKNISAQIISGTIIDEDNDNYQLIVNLGEISFTVLIIGD